MGSVMRVKIDGKTWSRKVVPKIVCNGHELWGLCEHDRKVIRIVRNQKPRHAMDTDLHEALHAIFPYLQEHAIHNASRDLTELLYDKLGYRRIQKPPETG